ncbi:hydrogenase maturation protease [Pseudofrankia sp. DC12]|uniref:hydrogenase maturation protease n=1 Tax=Pseudofrankia sp. DC12 TaxID=683315 RepID=UPI0006963E02|nr:hydrogenase maturation protease [Pseudofrankia sp. DC12]
MTRTLVAGVGNVLLGDDGFGVAVARRLAAGPALPPGVTVADYGIAGTHLAFDAADSCDELLLIDAVPPWPVGPATGADPSAAAGPATAGTGLAQPGELRLLELPAPAAAAWTAAPGGGPAASPAGPGRAGTPGDGHAMTPDAVLRLLALLGGGPERVLLVGCVPARVEEGLGLSPPVVAAVAPAARLVRAVLAGEAGQDRETGEAGHRAQPPPGRPPQGRSQM